MGKDLKEQQNFGLASDKLQLNSAHSIISRQTINWKLKLFTIFSYFSIPAWSY